MATSPSFDRFSRPHIRIAWAFRVEIMQHTRVLLDFPANIRIFLNEENSIQSNRLVISSFEDAQN
jgi:hypothetical protein